MKDDKNNNKLPGREELERLLLLAGIMMLLVLSIKELHMLQNRAEEHEAKISTLYNA